MSQLASAALLVVILPAAATLTRCKLSAMCLLSSPQAKTIDLCNNPLTKEPKLQSARRIIAEWPDLNREAEEFTAAVGRMQVRQAGT